MYIGRDVVYPESSYKISLPLNTGSLNCLVFMDPTVCLRAFERNRSVLRATSDSTKLLEVIGFFIEGVYGNTKEETRRWRRN